MAPMRVFLPVLGTSHLVIGHACSIILLMLIYEDNYLTPLIYHTYMYVCVLLVKLTDIPYLLFKDLCCTP